MEYETLLDEAYKNVKSNGNLNYPNTCGRFEILKVVGHHEGSRTLIDNFCRVASCIRRNPEHLMKFLNKELASSSEICGERLIFSRKVSSMEVNDKIQKYVNQFVLCSKCKKPDTELVEEEGKLFLRCLACGNKCEIHRI